MGHRSLALLVVLQAPLLAQSELESGFRDPPASARPHTWWHWMNGNITKEGITADLEAMKAVGLGGAQIFNVSESIPAGPIKFMSAEWRALVKHAASEADRLGLELCMHDCAGWSSSGGPWITPEHAMQTVVTSEVQVTGPAAFAAVLPRPETRLGFYREIAVLAFPTPADGAQRIADVRQKAGYEARYGMDPSLAEFPAGAAVPRERIVDLSGKLGADGKLAWDVPAGTWTILRFGYTPTGAVNAPAPESGRGLECDKLSRAGMDAHWAGIIAPVLQDLGPLAGKVLRNLLIDSYEVGHQNWSADFRAEFTRRRGYDPVPYLPAMTGRVVESGEVSERFLWDLRRTIADLFAENYYSYFAELCHEHGLLASIEPYDGPFEGLQVARDADIPMGEFWVGGGESNSCKLAASVAHVAGRTIVGAESFTAEPRVGRWLNHPYSLKSIGDLVFATGVNRCIIHRYAHQPWLDRFPGMTMGQWGTHFERTTTWWKQGAAWLSYLARCQFLLQQGRFVADAVYFAGEAAPNGAPLRPECKAAGYDYDSCGPDAVLAMSVEDGWLKAPSGMRWRVLVLPESPFMTVRLAEKVQRLVEQGATVIGPRPVRSPTLAELGEGDARVSAIGQEVWGDCEGILVKEHVFGKGRVVQGRTVPEVLASLGVPPDFALEGGRRHKLAWIHRSTGDAEIYFVSNQRAQSDEFACTFRVSGRLPELWHADTGAIEPAPVWSDLGDGQATVRRTIVPIRFDPTGSVFVVFRRAAPREHLLVLSVPGTQASEPHLPKIEIQKAVYEAVDGAGGADVTAKVAALVAAGEVAVPANNSTFGDPTYMHIKRLRVEFTLDGKPMTATADENDVLELVHEAAPVETRPASSLVVDASGAVELRAFEPGLYEVLSTANAGYTEAPEPLHRLVVPALPVPVVVAGPWSLRFPSGWGAPAEVKLEHLISWTEHPDAGVRYFSGTAEYATELALSPELGAADSVPMLDLGDVRVSAEVTLSDRALGTWWKPPFRADVTGIGRPGKNELLVRVTNLWVNRLIGDEQFPDDCTWKGITLAEWPSWLLEGKP